MGKREAVVAYEEQHGPSCAADCSCGGGSIEKRIRDLEERVAAHERESRPATSAHEYVAKDASGRLVFGPTADFQEAKMHAQRARGYVELVVGGASEDCAHPHPPEVPTGPCVTEGAEKKDPKFERCVKHVKAEGSAKNPWAVCHAALGREPEPFKYKHVPWHRDGKGYYADVEPYGRIRVQQRTQDKRGGKLAWYAVAKKVEVVQAETKVAVLGLVEEHVRNPGGASEARETPCVAIVPQGDVDVIQRTEACTPRVGVRIDTPKALHAAMRERVAKLGSEEVYVVGVTIQAEMLGQPVQIAVGQYSGVRVDVADVVGAAATLRKAGAESAWLAHCHPSGHGHTPSDVDRELTKRTRKGMDAIAMPFRGHVVLSERHWAKA